MIYANVSRYFNERGYHCLMTSDEVGVGDGDFMVVREVYGASRVLLLLRTGGISR